MAEMLSYLNGESTQYVWNRQLRLEYADENFAREIMQVSVHSTRWSLLGSFNLDSRKANVYLRDPMLQLFSIGLYMLNNDGTRKLDGNGKSMQTYTNDDIK
jgi:uncharacterized protein (DUF1800 family)